MYLWWRDRAATFIDDLAAHRAGAIEGGWVVSRLGLRDAAMAWRIEGRGGLGRRVRRWQVPCTVSAAELAAVGGPVDRDHVDIDFLAHDGGPGVVVCSVAGVVALFVPLDRWRFRCQALPSELMRPISRGTFVRQFLAAMLLDFGRWTLVATALTLLGYVPVLWFDASGVPTIILYHLSMLWGAALLFYGSVLVTLRLRYWLSWMLGLFLFMAMATFLTIPLVVHWFVAWSTARGGTASPALGYLIFALVVLIYAGLGVGLMGLTYWRWLRMEIS